jgi:subtilisin family serine protease
MPDLDDLVDLARLRALLAEGTGMGVRIAVLDTGVDAAHPALEGSVRRSYEVVRVGAKLACRPAKGEDLVGHGTACAGIIHSVAPEAELSSMRVIGKNAEGTGEQFIAGLRWAIDEKFDVVNLSLGTMQQRFRASLQELTERAYFAGVLLVAAGNNQQAVSYPANFASLIAVDNHSFSDPLTFNFKTGQPVELQAHGIYVRAPSPGGNYQLWTGTSFACPHVTGIVARLRSVIPDLTALQAKALLWCLRANREEPSVSGRQAGAECRGGATA